MGFCLNNSLPFFFLPVILSFSLSLFLTSLSVRHGNIIVPDKLSHRAEGENKKRGGMLLVWRWRWVVMSWYNSWINVQAIFPKRAGGDEAVVILHVNSENTPRAMLYFSSTGFWDATTVTCSSRCFSVSEEDCTVHYTNRIAMLSVSTQRKKMEKKIMQHKKIR